MIFQTVGVSVGITMLLFTSSLAYQKPIEIKTEEAPIVEHTQTFEQKLLSAPLLERRQLVKEKIVELAAQYGISEQASVIDSTIAKCENIPLDPKLQSKHHYKSDHPEWGVKKGDQEQSYGLAMIHLPSHPKITLTQAEDPLFALEWMVKEFAEGRAWQWSCYNQFKN